MYYSTKSSFSGTLIKLFPRIGFCRGTFLNNISLGKTVSRQIAAIDVRKAWLYAKSFVSRSGRNGINCRYKTGSGKFLRGDNTLSTVEQWMEAAQIVVQKILFAPY